MSITLEDLQKAQNEINAEAKKSISQIESKLNENIENKVKKLEEDINKNVLSSNEMEAIKISIDSLKKELDEKDKNINQLKETLEKQGEKIAENKQMNMTPINHIRENIGKCLEDFVKNRNNEIRVEASKEFVIKDAASDTHTIGTVPSSVYPNGSTANVSSDWLLVNSSQRINQWFGAPVLSNNILNYINILSLTGRNLIANVWGSKSGDAAFTPECGIKPIIKQDIGIETSKAGKVAVRARLSEEHFKYVWQTVDNEIMPRFTQNLTNSIAKTIFDGNADFNGIITNASAYTVVPSHKIFKDPNNLDALSVAVNQLEILEWTPNIIAINPIDRVSFTNTKGTDGHYSTFNNGSINIVNGNTFFVGTTSTPIIYTNSVAPGSLLIASNDAFKVGIEDELIMRLSNSDQPGDFSRNIWTLILEKFIAVFAPTESSTGILYDTYANIKTAITTP